MMLGSPPLLRRGASAVCKGANCWVRALPLAPAFTDASEKGHSLRL